MSKIGEKPILIQEDVKISQDGDTVLVIGPLGEIKLKFPKSLTLEIGEKEAKITRADDEKKTKSVHGTMNRLICNAIEGTTKGFSKTLEVVGTGYRAVVEGGNLILNLGFSHPINFPIPEGTKIETQENKIKVFGINKELVGIVSDKIKRFKKPDVYKGKGIRYLGEKLKLKPGKAAAKATVTGGK